MSDIKPHTTRPPVLVLRRGPSTPTTCQSSAQHSDTAQPRLAIASTSSADPFTCVMKEEEYHQESVNWNQNEESSFHSGENHLPKPIATSATVFSEVKPKEENYDMIIQTQEPFASVPNQNPINLDSILRQSSKMSNFSMMLAVCKGSAGKFKCSTCGSEFLTVAEIYNHGQTVHPTDFEFQANRSKQKAEQEDGTEAKVKFECSICQSLFPNAEDFELHMNAHNIQQQPKEQSRTRNRPHKCDLCNRAFLSSSNLDAHVNNVHFNLGREKKLECVECDYVTPYASHLKRHAVRHFVESQQKPKSESYEHQKSEQEFNCPQCPEKFFTSEERKSHMSVYKHYTTQFKCEDCNKVFARYQTLKRHREQCRATTIIGI